MSDDRITRVSVRMLDKEYQVACPAEERSDLLDSAEYLDAKMREIRDTGKVVGLDRIAVMAALNIANELIKMRHGGGSLDGDLGARLRGHARARRDRAGEEQATGIVRDAQSRPVRIGAACGVRHGPGYLSTLSQNPGESGSSAALCRSASSGKP